jgi:hypothetical protein
LQPNKGLEATLRNGAFDTYSLRLAVAAIMV